MQKLVEIVRAVDGIECLAQLDGVFGICMQNFIEYGTVPLLHAFDACKCMHQMVQIKRKAAETLGAETRVRGSRNMYERSLDLPKAFFSRDLLGYQLALPVSGRTISKSSFLRA